MKTPVAATKHQEQPEPGPNQPVDSWIVVLDDAEGLKERRKRKKVPSVAEPKKEEPTEDAAERELLRRAMIRLQQKTRGKGR